MKILSTIFFKNSQRICHTGIVYHVDGKRVYTIEGNAGNVVCRKSYTLGDSYIAGFLMGVCRGEDLRTCMQLGALNASITIGYDGAW